MTTLSEAESDETPRLGLAAIEKAIETLSLPERLRLYQARALLLVACKP